jgi:hypothetical protein
VTDAEETSWRSRPRADTRERRNQDRRERPPHSDFYRDEELRLFDVMLVVWRHKLLVLGIGMSCAVLAYGCAKLLPKRYSSTIVVAPATDDPSSHLGGFGGAAAQLGGLAALAGMSVNTSTQRAETVAILSSVEVVDRYIRENSLLPVLYPKAWDAGRRRWKSDGHSAPPTLWVADQFFVNGVREIVDDPKTGMVKLTVTWMDPKLCAQWANGLVAAVNSYMRSEAISNGQRNIAYLDGETHRTVVLDQLQGIYAMREAQLKRVMLARGNEEFALKVIDRAMVPERPSSPRPIIWTAVAFALGLIAAAVFVCARAAMRAVQP